jgi:hypothetical protein
MKQSVGIVDSHRLALMERSWGRLCTCRAVARSSRHCCSAAAQLSPRWFTAIVLFQTLSLSLSLPLPRQAVNASPFLSHSLHLTELATQRLRPSLFQNAAVLAKHAHQGTYHPLGPVDPIN